MISNTQKWSLIVAMWVALLFAIFAFYWVKVRPGKIRQLCSQKAKQVCEESKVELSNMLEINRAVYSECLKSYGIDK